MNPMGIFGGTFDPIHYAHLRTAFELQQALRLREIRFLPAGNPPHRDPPFADAQQRLRMVRAATAGQPGFVVDEREIHKSGPSYTVETLRELRHEFPDRSLCLIVGMDAFLSLPRWHEWRELFELAHLRTAFELLQALRLKEIRFLPAGNPPHRDRPFADARLRLEMVQAATAGQPGFVVDDREVCKEGPSYSVETLSELRHEYPDRSLCLIVGMDAFLSLPKWYQWRELLQLAHLIVAHRPGWRVPGMGPLGELLVDRGTGRIQDLHELRFGCIYIHAVTQLEISSTDVRQLIALGRDPRYLMPDPVRQLILDTHCYSKQRTS